jgi:ParB-like chromosome segregation protein Spo0J
MKTITIHLPLSIIKIDGGTQQRDIDIPTQQRYAKLMAESVKFPPVEVVYDGKNYFLTDGFHRYFAAKENNVKMISTNVTDGTQRDALWISYGVNNLHGLPKKEKDNRHIILEIHADDEWKSKTQKEIADHVGVTQQYVAKVLKDTEVPVSQPVVTSDVKSPVLSQVAENKEDTDNSGQSIPTENLPAKEAFVSDSVGNNVPKNLRQVFLDQQEIQHFIQRIDNLKSDLKLAVAEKPALWFYFRSNPCDTDLANVRRQLKFTIPYALCPSCLGRNSDKCKGACKGSGFLNKEVFDALPPEMKKKAK